MAPAALPTGKATTARSLPASPAPTPARAGSSACMSMNGTVETGRVRSTISGRSSTTSQGASVCACQDAEAPFVPIEAGSQIAARLERMIPAESTAILAATDSRSVQAESSVESSSSALALSVSRRCCS